MRFETRIVFNPVDALASWKYPHGCRELEIR